MRGPEQASMPDWPAVRRSASDWRARLRALPPPAVDAFLTVLALAGQAAPFVFTTRGDGRPWTVVEFLPILVVALPVMWRRHAPVGCLLVAAGGIAAYALVGADGPEQPVWYGALVVMYTVAELAPRRPRLVALGLAAVGITLIGGLFGSFAVGIREAILWGAAYALGRSAHVRRANAAMLAERASRLAGERERARIARDMHDILGHAISVMIVQAEAGPVAVRADPARAEAVFDTIADAGRDAMGQLRRTLGLLDGPTDSRVPQPTLDRLPGLVAGITVPTTLESIGTPRPVPPDIEVTAYRIIQEALTNVIKHAHADTVTVGLSWRATELGITVVDDGRHAEQGDVSVDGAGLIGIRERAAACGGTAWFGPMTGARGFQVSARLPIS